MAVVPQELLKCVAFVGYKNALGVYQLAGSGFWITRSGPEDIEEIYRPAYFVTARHVIEKIQRETGANGLCGCD